MRDERCEPVVVAIANLVVGDGVVFVDDRHDAEIEQPPERLPCVQILRALREVVRREQHLAGDQVVTRQNRAHALHEPRLANRGDRLEHPEVRGTDGEPEGGEAGRNGTRAHQDDLVAFASGLGNVATELHERGFVELARFGGDRRGADLDDGDAHEKPSTNSSSTGPIRTVSPSRAPARLSARSTPIFRNRS